MKILNKISAFIFILAVVFACETDEDKLYSLDYVTAPTNVSAIFNITQDNTGIVTIIPNADGASSYRIDFGDGSEVAEYTQGQEVTHTYIEGVYQLSILAVGSTGLSTEFIQEVNISFKAPENLKIIVENDLSISKKVNISATANYATVFDIYFGDVADEEPTATMPDELISHLYEVAGDYEIRVIAKSAGAATTDSTFTFTVTEILAPVASAPTPPSRNVEDVISIYSSAYADIEGINYNPDWGQSGQGSSYGEFDLNGDKMLQYINLSYQGIALADGTSVDITGMEFLHIDVWTPDVTKLETSLISGTNGEKPVSSDLTAFEWTSIDLAISAFTDQGLTVADIIQLKLVGDPWAAGTVFVDNIYFYKAKSSSPTQAAPVPPARYVSDVISIFSDAYTNITINEWNPGWGQATTLTSIDFSGNNALLYKSLDFTGIVTDYDNPTDLSAMTFVHFDYWTSDADKLALKLVNTVVGSEDIVEVSAVTVGSWVSVDIALAEYSTDLTAVTQLLFESSSATVYIDNLYFYKAPTEAAPTPTANAADVISIFSDAYTNITVNEWNPGWGQTTTLTNVDFGGNNVLLYQALNYTGIVTDYDNPTDLSGKTYVHFDYWTNDATSLALKLVNTIVDNEDIEVVPSIILGSWAGVDIALADYSTDLTGVTQLLFESSGAMVFIDNLYFY
ncbi:hypothetical protein QUH73_01465 [Labilibaculum sp. K2S]|uniref:hypothetical protein n=1 Tax=Labilibaculum sp. K2S TaxID=3056386 RepID=UPI0025A497F2|nr:hypothetical protein [Labilibaculum sp. K2S]MDM8158474.1 hypothetical protein [Labilibaculum sp. K2S]